MSALIAFGTVGTVFAILALLWRPLDLSHADTTALKSILLVGGVFLVSAITALFWVRLALAVFT